MEPLEAIIDDFPRHPMQSGRVMRQLLEKDPAAFFSSALPLLRAPVDCHGFQYLLALLLSNDLIFEPLVDPEVFSFAEAVTLGKLLIKIEPLLDIRMIRSLSDSRHHGDANNDFDQKIASANGIRLLEVIATISDGARILPLVSQLLHHSSIWVRSKAALIVGKGNKNHKWVEQRLSEPDARVRANAVESLWGVDSPGSKDVFLAAITDTDNRVIGNALLGLYRLGEVSSIPLILDLLNHPDSLFRTTGVWVMGETGDPRFRGHVARLLSDSDGRVRTSAFRSVAKIKQNEAKYSSGTDVSLHLQPLAGPGSSWIRMSAALWAGSGAQGRIEPVGGLKATQFLIQENRQPVAQFEVDEVSHPEPMSVAFAIPRGIETEDAFHRHCQTGLSLALPHKKKSDSWLILKYLPDVDQPDSGRSGMPARGMDRGMDRSVLHLEAQPETVAVASPAPLPDDVRFLSEPEAIMAAAAVQGTRALLPTGILDTVRALVPALAQARGIRHLVFVACESHEISNDPGWAQVARAAKAAKIKIHALGLGAFEQLKGLADKTEGEYHELTSADEIPMALERLYARLSHHYLIRYRSTTLDWQDVSVQVYSEHGVAESQMAQPVSRANVA